jgi:hypothetical protein
MKKLKLNRVTVKPLRQVDLDKVAGGVLTKGDSWDANCSNSCNSCVGIVCPDYSYRNGC